MKFCSLILFLLFSSCNINKKPLGKDEQIIELLKETDVHLNTPREGEWLYNRNEPGQNLKEYKSIDPLSTTEEQNKIYILPLGELSTSQKNIVKYTADYIQIFFDLTTIVLEPLSDKTIPKTYKRVREDGSIQLLAPYILDSILKKRIPEDAIALMAITEKDLYPKPSWNFVFGLATLKDRVGVSSIYRYSKAPIDLFNYGLCLQRLISTCSHEIGHMFSMRHCTYGVCVMNGSNSLSESDSRPNKLCSQCLSKLQWNLGFDIKKRTEKLDSFFVYHKLTRDEQIIKKDLALIQ